MSGNIGFIAQGALWLLGINHRHLPLNPPHSYILSPELSLKCRARSPKMRLTEKTTLKLF